MKDKKEWLDKLVREVEGYSYHAESLPFKILRLKENGFLVKVNRLFAFISFYHMPWKYHDTGSWVAIAPNLIGKRFCCKIHKVTKDPLSIIVNGEVPQFKKVALTIGADYNGLIIKKTDYGLFVDIGYHFNWCCGSIVSLMHKTQMIDIEKLKDYKIGREVTVIYQGLNDNGQYLYGND